MPLQHSRSRISEFPSDFCTGLFQTTWSETRPFPSTGETRRVGGNHWRQLLVHRWRCTGKIVFFSWREVLLLNSRGSSADKTKRLSGTRRETARFLGKILEFPRPLVCLSPLSEMKLSLWRTNLFLTDCHWLRWETLRKLFENNRAIIEEGERERTPLIPEKMEILSQRGDRVASSCCDNNNNYFVPDI